MLARFRREPLFQYSNPWVGKPIDYNLVLPDEALKAKTIGAIYECALWFFEFHRICDESIYPLQQGLSIVYLEIYHFDPNTVMVLCFNELCGLQVRLAVNGSHNSHIMSLCDPLGSELIDTRTPGSVRCAEVLIEVNDLQMPCL